MIPCAAFANACLLQPDLDVLLLLAGILLLYAECNLPGKILPGCVGLLLVLLACFGLHQLSVSPAAFAILAAGLALLLLELFHPLHNLFAVAGAIALSAGLFRLVTSPDAHVHLLTAVAAALSFESITLVLARIALRARRNKAPHPPVRLTFADSLTSTPHRRAE